LDLKDKKTVSFFDKVNLIKFQRKQKIKKLVKLFSIFLVLPPNKHFKICPK